MDEREVLLVRHPYLSEAVAIGEIGNGVHLIGGGIARNTAMRLQRECNDSVARLLMRGDIGLQPSRKASVGEPPPRQLRIGVRQAFKRGPGEEAADTGDLRLRQIDAIVRNLLPLGFD